MNYDLIGPGVPGKGQRLYMPQPLSECSPEERSRAPSSDHELPLPEAEQAARHPASASFGYTAPLPSISEQAPERTTKTQLAKEGGESLQLEEMKSSENTEGRR